MFGKRSAPKWAVIGALVLLMATTALSRHEAKAATDCGSVSEIPVAECQALVALYNSTNGPGWAIQRNWLVTNTPCSWHGVTCQSGGHVTSIVLENNQLSGGIPAEIGNLSSLQLLDLRRNQLSGGIPAEIGNLSSLQVLSLDNNQLSSVPAEISNLSSLVALDLDNNQLSGGIPAEIGNLSSLQSLSLDYNQLNSVPAEIGNLSNLEVLALNNNQLSSLPGEIGNLSSLGFLYLTNNQLSSLPAEIGNLSSLGFLDISSNSTLAGPLPVSLLQLSALQTFYFADTNLCEPGDAVFQGWLANIPNLISTNVPCVSPSVYMPLITTEQ